MDNLHVVYDFAGRFPKIGIMLVPLVFVAVGLGIFIYNKNHVDRKAVMTFGINKRKYGIFFGLLFSSCALLFAIIIIPGTLREWLKTKNVYEKKEYLIVEGEVEKYHPMQWGGHETENFDLNGAHFEFSDYDESDYGYNNAASHGGAIKAGEYARIWYFNNGNKNVILRLEIATGEKAQTQ